MNDPIILNDTIGDSFASQMVARLPDNLPETLALMWCAAAGMPLEFLPEERQAFVRGHFRALVRSGVLKTLNPSEYGDE
jgi:hypothetical protein